MMGLGWKTILGGALLAMGQIFGAAITDCPVEAWVPWMKWFAGIFNAAGMVLGAVGISSKVSTATNAITRSLDVNRDVVSRSVNNQERSEVIERIIEKRIPYIAKIINAGDIVKIKRSDGKIEVMSNVTNQIKPDHN